MIDSDKTFRHPPNCAPGLAELDSLGFDDVIIALMNRPAGQGRKGLARRYDFTDDDLAQVRALLPKDSRDYHDTGDHW